MQQPSPRHIRHALSLATALGSQGTTSAEVLAVRSAGAAARGGTAYLNLEPGDCHGDSAAVEALTRAGVARVVVGTRHPLRHLRSRGIGALRAAGLRVGELAGWCGVRRLVLQPLECD